MKKINNFLENNMEKIIAIFLFLQPVIDVLTAISMMKFHHSFILGLATRFLFLLLMIYYLFHSNKKSKRYLTLLFSYCLFFLLTISFLKGKYALGYELKSLIKTFYFPFLFLSFYEVFVKKKKKYNSRDLKKLYLVYLLLVILPNLFHIGFRSYEVTKGGSIGFFYTANEIGAILAILMPIYFYYLIKRKNKLLILLGIIVTFYLYFSIGTKAPLLLFILLLGYYFIKYIRKLIVVKNYKQISMVLGILLIGFFSLMMIIPKTNFYKNIKVHLEFLEIEKPSDILKSGKTIDHFIFSERLTFWSNTNKIYQKSSLLEKLVGIGYINNYSTDDTSMKMVEMDFVDLFYRHGIIGFFLYMIPFLALLSKIVKIILKSHRKLSGLSISYIFSILFSILLMILTGHVLLSPSVSIYVALILVLLYNELYKESKI